MMFFFFKQKTAYEMRISDLSSDVCSSDLHQVHRPGSHQSTYHSADRQDAGHSADQSGCDHHDEGHHGGEDAPERKDGKTARQVHRSWWPRRREPHRRLAGRNTQLCADRKSDEKGQSVSVRVDLGGSRITKKKKQTLQSTHKNN